MGHHRQMLTRYRFTGYTGFDAEENIGEGVGRWEEYGVYFIDFIECKRHLFV
jgi:hypothetical protein